MYKLNPFEGSVGGEGEACIYVREAFPFLVGPNSGSGGPVAFTQYLSLVFLVLQWSDTLYKSTAISIFKFQPLCVAHNRQFWPTFGQNNGAVASFLHRHMTASLV